MSLCDPWTVAHQAPLSMGFSKQEYWSGLLCCLSGDLPNLGIKPVSLMFSALALVPPGKPYFENLPHVVAASLKSTEHARKSDKS